VVYAPGRGANHCSCGRILGFADAQIDIDALVTKTMSENVSAVSSTITSGGSLTINAGKKADIIGSDVSAGDTIALNAKTVAIEAAKNTSSSITSESNAHVTITFSTSTGAGINASASDTESCTDSISYTNSHLNAANIIINSTADTTVKGGVVTAENSLKLDIGGDLTVESLQDKSENSLHTIGVSMSGGNSSSGGANGKISSGNKRWVTEQTSLTGGNVDIYVEDKSTLKGAVIASDRDKLKLDTGTLEYSHIKDKDSSNNLGGGVNASGIGSDNLTGSVNATYGFTDKRQTNFATIGEGTIIVRDAAEGTTGIEGLNRDVSISQYNTKDVSLSGGFTVDKATVNLIAHPENIGVNTVRTVDKGIDEGKDRLIDTTERIINCYKSINQRDGLTWESKDERLSRLENELLFNDNVKYAEGDNIQRISLATDPNKMHQESYELKKTIGEVYDEIHKDDSKMLSTIDKYMEIQENNLEKAQEKWKLLYPEGGSETLVYDKNNNTKERNQIYDELLYYSSKSQIAALKYQDQILIHDYIIETPKEQFVNETTSKLCNVETYWAYGRAVDKEERSFKEFYSEELNAGRIGSVKNGKANAYYGAGGYEWSQKYGLDLDGSLKNNVGTEKRPIYRPINDKDIKDYLDKNAEGVAIIWKETNTVGVPTHYSCIVKNEKGIWLDYDHNMKSNGKPVDFSKVYKITQTKIKQEKVIKENN